MSPGRVGFSWHKAHSNTLDGSPAHWYPFTSRVIQYPQLNPHRPGKNIQIPHRRTSQDPLSVKWQHDGTYEAPVGRGGRIGGRVGPGAGGRVGGGAWGRVGVDWLPGWDGGGSGGVGFFMSDTKMKMEKSCDYSLLIFLFTHLIIHEFIYEFTNNYIYSFIF